MTPRRGSSRLWPLAVKLVSSFRRIIGQQKLFYTQSPPPHPRAIKDLWKLCMFLFMLRAARGERRFMTACNKSHTHTKTHTHNITQAPTHTHTLTHTYSACLLIGCMKQQLRRLPKVKTPHVAAICCQERTRAQVRVGERERARARLVVPSRLVSCRELAERRATQTKPTAKKT